MTWTVGQIEPILTFICLFEIINASDHPRILLNCQVHIRLSLS